MANKIYIVELSSEERARLRGMLSNSKSSSQASLKARILLKADQGAEGDSWTDSRICEALETNSAMVERVRQKCVTEGVDAVFRRKPRATPPTARIFDGEAEAKLITLACPEPPEGYARWSIRLLAKRVTELQIVDKVHHNTVGRTLKKTRSSPIAASIG